MARGESDGTPARRERGLAAFGVSHARDADAEADAAPVPSPAPAVPAREPISVGELVHAAKRVLEDAPPLADALVRGEISGFRAYASGHWYFSLKDEHAQISCVMFRGANARVPFEPEDGLAVVAQGGVGVYAQRGQMQFLVTRMTPDGAGALAVALEQLKRRLADEGLFDEERKRALPPFPRRIGVVTSAQGAVWHDIQKVARRRFPGIELILRPVRVQGDGAAAEIAAAIAQFNAHRAADVLIVGRGGGSLEDLWAFNEERTVRAIAGSEIPVVSAVGHETDVTLADFAADARAATPSHAAELVVPEVEAWLEFLVEAEARLRRALGRRADVARQRFDGVARASVLARPERWLAEHRQRHDEAALRLEQSMRRVVAAKDADLRERAASLDALSPLAVLARGFSVVSRTRDGRAVRRVDDVAAGDVVEVRVPDGRFRAEVKEKKKEPTRLTGGDSR